MTEYMLILKESNFCVLDSLREHAMCTCKSSEKWKEKTDLEATLNIPHARCW